MFIEYKYKIVYYTIIIIIILLSLISDHHQNNSITYHRVDISELGGGIHRDVSHVGHTRRVHNANHFAQST